MSDLISIIVPCYNAEEYITRLVKSVLQQSYSNFELILIDDGSTDNTLPILQEFKDKRLKVISKKNTGVSDTRNVGLQSCTGKYICFLDSDDYIDQGYLEEIMTTFQKNENIMLLNFGFYSDVENKNEVISSDKICYQEKFYQTKEEIKEDFVSLWDHTMLYNIWNKVYLRSIIEENKIKFVGYNWGEDVIFNQAYLDKIQNLYNSEKAFYHYIRERKGALTSSYKPTLFEIRKNEFYAFNQYFDTWGIKRDDYYEFSCRRFIERVLGCLENVYCSRLTFLERRQEIKKMVHDNLTREALKYIQPKSKKIKIMILPIRWKSTFLTMLLGSVFHTMKVKFPSLFNKLKNRR